MFRSIFNQLKSNSTFSVRAYSTRLEEKLKGVVLGIYETELKDEPKLTKSTKKFNEQHNGRLLEMIKESGMTGRLNETRLFTNLHPDYHLICVTGLGKECDEYNPSETIYQGMENVRQAAASGCIALSERNCRTMFVEAMEFPEQAAEGSTLAVWNLNKIRKNELPKIDLFDSSDMDDWLRGTFKADAQNFARKLTEMPSNLVTPSNFAQFTMDLLCPCDLTVELRNMDWIKSHHLTAFLAVARSSCEPPVMLEMTYCGGEQGDPPVLLVGSGLTYNSGGLCLKDKYDLSEARAAMSGAASVVAIMRAVANLMLPINVSAIVPLCESMPSGMAFKPGDVLTALNGYHIDVSNTSNAAVILLSDVLCYGRQTYKPRMIIDVSCVSKGAEQAFGGAASCVFTNTTKLWNQVNLAGSITGDRVRRLPLWEHFSKMIKHKSTGNISNTGDGTESACLAAAFLKEFCDGVDWIHMDIEGVKLELTEHLLPYLEKYCMTGRPTRTVVQLLYQMACPDATVPKNVNCVPVTKSSSC